MEIKNIVSSGAVVYTVLNGEINYLLLKHRKGGHWGFPKGRIMSNESKLENSKREVFEETGIKEIVYDPKFETLEKYSFIEKEVKYDKEVTFFLAYSPKMDVKISEEHTEFLWANIDKSLQTLQKESDKELIEKAHIFIIHKLALGDKKCL